MASLETEFIVPKSPAAGRSASRTWVWRIVAIIAFLLVSSVFAVGFYVWNRANAILATQRASGDQIVATVGEGVLGKIVAPGSPAIGPATARVTVVEFSDFECPYCGQMYPVMKELQRRYKDRVRFIYRHFPLFDIHPQAVPAALAAECAKEQGKFWEMHDLLFANQSTLGEDAYMTYAIQLSLDAVQFSGCYRDGTHRSVIEQDLRDGVAAGVRATPTIFVNNAMISGAVPIDQIETILLRELAK